MKKILSAFFTLSLLASTPLWASDHCSCSESCRKACAEGKTADCNCASKDCKDCGCSDHQ